MSFDEGGSPASVPADGDVAGWPSVASVRRGLARVVRVIGPGVVVMLADTDAASVLTAAESGRAWGYRLIGLQLLLIPVIYLAQELGVRAALAGGEGFDAAVRRCFGRGPAIAIGIGMLASAFGALVTQLCGLAGVGEIFGVPRGVTAWIAAAGLLAMFLGRSHRSIERIALGLGALELTFLIAAWRADPSAAALLDGATSGIALRGDYLMLVAANIGTSVMPWTLAYQQSALAAKRLGPGDLGSARTDTAIGAVVCQLITSAILIAAATAPEGAAGAAAIEGVPRIAQAFAAHLGGHVGLMLFVLGLSGAAIVAAIVVSTTAIWTTCGILGLEVAEAPAERAPARPPARLPRTALPLVVLAALLAGAAALVGSGADLVRLAVEVGALNTVMLPAVFAVMFVMARRSPRPRMRLGGARAAITAAVLGLVAAVGFGACAAGFWLS